MSSAVLMFGIFLLFLVLGMPIAMCMGIAAMAAIIYIGVPISLMPQLMFSSLDQFPLLAVPFFIMAGALMQACGMTRRIIDLAYAFVGHIRGGLAMVCVMAAMIFASISGAGVAATAAIGSMLIPAMIKRGYKPSEAAALQATAGAIGVIIPPSILMIIFGATASLSIDKIFLSGVTPGILVGIALMITAYISSVRNRYPVEKKFEFARVLKAFRHAVLPLGMPVIILGGIFKGIFTPTEAAVVAVVYTLFVAFVIERNVKLSQLPGICLNVAQITSIATFLVATTSMLGWVLASEHIPQKIATALLANLHNKYVILLLINILLLFVGMFLDNIPTIIIFVPVLMPIAKELGIDPYHMGIVICFTAGIGLATPPVGPNLFVAAAISKSSLAEASHAAIPYFIAMAIVSILVTFIPALSLWLPRLVGS